jgi:hypothetical protein
MIKKLAYIILLIISVVGCKSTKITSSTADAAISAKSVIKNHYANTFNKETINAKLKVKYIGKSDLPGVTASLRIKKNDTIWISLTKLGFPIGKALITPNRVSYYEKINHTYFDGDFALLSNWLGADLDFEKVQNLLLGQSILDLKKDKFNINLKENKYLLTPKKQYDLFSILFMINPDNFKMNSQEIIQKNENKTLKIDYGNYSKIQGELFPTTIKIAASDIKNTSTIDVDYKSVEFNKPVSFPFSIPSNYQQIVLK